MPFHRQYSLSENMKAIAYIYMYLLLLYPSLTSSVTLILWATLFSMEWSILIVMEGLYVNQENTSNFWDVEIIDLCSNIVFTNSSVQLDTAFCLYNILV